MTWGSRGESLDELAGLSGWSRSSMITISVWSECERSCRSTRSARMRSLSTSTTSTVRPRSASPATSEGSALHAGDWSTLVSLASGPLM